MLVKKYQVLLSLHCIILCIPNVPAFTSSSIPQHLKKCYDIDYENNHLNDQPPFKQRTLIELLRNYEQNRTEPNIRLISNEILHIAKFDGIQRSAAAISGAESGSTLYRGSGPQFNKYQLLVDHLTPGPKYTDAQYETLEDSEFCLLHFLISEALDTRERRDEKYTCLISLRNMSLKDGRDRATSEAPKSGCPEQKGVMKTKWGTVSPGHLIAGIASALQRDKVGVDQLLHDINNTKAESEAENLVEAPHDSAYKVDNVWVATLGGILAQTIVNQASEHPRILLRGRWNDTLLPTRFYLNGDHWDVNDASLLGAIDGLILASEVRSWSNTYPAASLSQLIDMYYSERGIAYDRSIRACNRGKKLAELLTRYDFVSEISSAVEVLNNFGEYQSTIIEDRIDPLTRAAVEQFKIAADSLIPSYGGCQESSEDNVGRREIILIADQTYSPYELRRFLSVLGEEADVSYYASSIGLLNGNEGNWMINVTNDVIRTFTTLSAVPHNRWPTGLTLTRCLHQIIAYYQNVSFEPCSDFERPYGKMVIVLAQSSYLTDDDLASSEQSIDSIRNIAPETRILYVTSAENSKSFNELERKWPTNSATVSANNLEETLAEISKELRRLPASVVNFYCNESKSNFEDYLTPGTKSVYEINAKYVAAAENLSVKFQGKSYGDISICAYRTQSMANKTCKHVTVNDEVTFKIEDHCSRGDSACSVQFAVSANNSALKCAAFECRYPDQVLMTIRTAWNRATPTREATSWSLLLVIALLYTKYVK